MHLQKFYEGANEECLSKVENNFIFTHQSSGIEPSVAHHPFHFLFYVFRLGISPDVVIAQPYGHSRHVPRAHATRHNKFLITVQHAQVFDKKTLDGGNSSYFFNFILNYTGFKIRSVLERKFEN